MKEENIYKEVLTQILLQLQFGNSGYYTASEVIQVIADEVNKAGIIVGINYETKSIGLAV